MRTLYEASNAVEAHMILNLLEQQGLAGRVDGEYLQGGIGELPAVGLVRVMVAEEDYDAAREIIDQWDSAPKEISSTETKKPGSRLVTFAVGFALGTLATWMFFRAPIIRDGIDHNRDGVLDDKWIYSASGRPLRNEIDRNLDGKIDLVYTFGTDGTAESASEDDDFDGVFETFVKYESGNPVVAEVDTDGDGYKDFRINFKNGVIFTNEYIYPATGLPHRVEYFKLGKISHVELDLNKDGKMDQRKNYDAQGEIISVEEIRTGPPKPF